MFGLIERLRNKSETYRHVVAGSTALVVTLVIFAVWMTVLFPSAITGKPVVAQEEKGEKPFALFAQNSAQAISAIKDHWNNMMNSFHQTKYETDNQIEIVSPEKDEATPKQMGAQ